MAEGIEAESEPRKDVAHDRDQRESVAGEAGSDEQAVDTGNGTEQRQVVWREGFDARPAPGQRALAQRRIDRSGDVETAAHAVVEHLPAVRRFVDDPRGPASADDDDRPRHGRWPRAQSWRSFGSRVSRNQSPSRLKASTTRRMASPGMNDTHQALVTKSRP